MTVNGGNRGNSFNVPGNSPSTGLTVNAGSGNDTVTVGNSTDGLGDVNYQQLVTVNGVAGHTTMVVNDQAGNAGGLLVQNNAVSQGFKQIAYTNLSNLIVDAQSTATTKSMWCERQPGRGRPSTPGLAALWSISAEL